MKRIQEKKGGEIEEKVEERIEISFADAAEAEKILELVRYANVCAQKPLVEDELLFIAKYPEIARKLLTLTPLT
jgi:homocitrate synthase NifV